ICATRWREERETTRRGRSAEPTTRLRTRKWRRRRAFCAEPLTTFTPIAITSYLSFLACDESLRRLGGDLCPCMDRLCEAFESSRQLHQRVACRHPRSRSELEI